MSIQENSTSSIDQIFSLQNNRIQASARLYLSLTASGAFETKEH